MESQPGDKMLDNQNRMGGITMATIINIVAYTLLALTGIVILGIALLAIITTAVNCYRCYRFRGHDGE